jgi:hypothetical protein
MGLPEETPYELTFPKTCDVSLTADRLVSTDSTLKGQENIAFMRKLQSGALERRESVPGRPMRVLKEEKCHEVG